MSFQSKRLRVQLPCGEGTVVEQAVDCPKGTACPPGSFFCVDTCVFGEHSRVGPEGLCNLPSCDFASNPCGIGSDPRFDPWSMVFDPEDLPVLRRSLEAQLDEIKKAEQALEEKRPSE